MSISKNDNENPLDFMSRCMNDPAMSKGFPDQSRRSKACMIKACDGMSHIEAADFQIQASKESYQYEDPKTGEVFTFNRKGVFRKNGRVLIPIQDNDSD